MIVGISELSRTVVAHIAPDEREPVEALLASYADDLPSIEKLAKQNRGEDMGFGMGELASISTGLVALCVVVVRWLGTHVADAADETIGARVKDLATRVFGGKPSEFNPVTLSAPLSMDQLAEVKRQVLKQAPKLGIDADTAVLIADSVAGALIREGRADDDT